MNPHLRLPVALFLSLNFVVTYAPLAEGDESPASPEQVEFFEAKVRPLLVEHCYECHSSQSKSVKGGLKLDSRSGLLKGGDSGHAVVPGKPADSSLVNAVLWKDFEMPPRGKLRDDQVATLVKWVELGAPWPEEQATVGAAEPTSYDWPRLQAEHWSFQPVRRPALPKPKNPLWSKNEIDLFVLAQLEKAALKPSPPAEPQVLIRRVYLDLIGLPPTPDEVEQFVRASETPRRDAAYAELIDRLLNRPQYGERWGRHWLDVARYSDGYGSFLDAVAMPNAWRYRDWVVAAFNQDLPYDQFVRLQIAGDVIGQEHAAATGFFALGPTYISDGGDLDATAQAMSETLDDRVDTLTRGLQGLTVSCARCHDHKFDPIPQLDYYSLAGVFKNTKVGEYPLAPADVVKKYDDYSRSVNERIEKTKAIRTKARNENRSLTDEEKETTTKLQAEVDELKKHPVPKYPLIHGLTEAGKSDMALAIRGNLRKPGPTAPRRFLRILAGEAPPPYRQGSGRTELAESLVSTNNPLTARVMINRVWQQHFGRGLVRTPSNFGKLGEKPTHPELLDWLAAEFMQLEQAASEGAAHTAWTLKRMHRLILLSATYQMSSEPNPQSFAVDGDNRFLWRANPRRLDVEAWRDSLLAVTGELDRQLGGQPTDKLLASQRRTIYASVSRNGDRFESDTFLRLFDFPLPRATSEGRTSSVVPQQALFLINNEFMAARSRALAAQLEQFADDDSSRIDYAYRLLYARPATEADRRLAIQFLRSSPKHNAPGQLSAWQQYAQVLLSANEFMHFE